ncbi:hypothetical protein CPB84DRAFT_1686065 [Gymnopilus junonius]|uniref:Uncharacterized protein n=1 Tax=Gymnopilus junonius TaxID=109634 RepID=A0A9P5NFT6_GYMJU|nr:hypothetical protein CPB84DRAFT_1686065 [Gymnopilus junonius]
MVVCTPTKKAHIYILRKAGLKFSDIGHILNMKEPTVSRNFHELEKQGDNPSFYLCKPIPGRPRVITPHAECRVTQLIYSGEC